MTGNQGRRPGECIRSAYELAEVTKLSSKIRHRQRPAAFTSEPGTDERAEGMGLTFLDLAVTGPGVLRLVDPDAVGCPADLVGATVFQAVNAVEVLASLDPGALDAAALRQWAEGAEQIRRMADAASTTVADHLEQTAPFRDEGFFTTNAWIRHRLQLSGPEAYRRVQTARMRRRLTDWDLAAHVGGVGVAQSE